MLCWQLDNPAYNILLSTPLHVNLSIYIKKAAVNRGCLHSHRICSQMEKEWVKITYLYMMDIFPVHIKIWTFSQHKLRYGHFPSTH